MQRRICSSAEAEASTKKIFKDSANRPTVKNMLRRIDATDPLGVDMTLRGCSSRFYDGILGKKNSEDDRRRRRCGTPPQIRRRRRSRIFRFNASRTRIKTKRSEANERIVKERRAFKYVGLNVMYSMYSIVYFNLSNLTRSALFLTVNRTRKRSSYSFSLPPPRELVSFSAQ